MSRERYKHSSYKRYSRKEFLRNKKPLIILMIIVLALLLAAAALIYVRYRQSREVIYYSEMEDCSLPVLTMTYHDRAINRIFGYTQEMEQQYIRDNIYILDSGYDIPIEVQMYGNRANSLEYALYDLDEEHLVQRSTVDRYDLEEDVLSASLRIENLIEQDKEYSLDIKLTDGNDRNIHYYTRVMYNSTSPLIEMMDMVLEHHDAMYDKTKRDLLAQYQEPNSAVNDSTNLGDISLSSTVNSMYWGTMGVQVITEPVISIVDVDSDIAFFRLTYQVGRTTEEGTREYYNVSEYYRTRMYGENKYILSYERTADQIFVPVAGHIGNKSVLVGIAHDLNLQTMTNLRGNVNVFVADKAIWYMDTASKTLQKVFSFETAPTDIRQNYNQHDIRLLKIAENGDFQFLVYGYMNRGLHEGQAGIGLYTYTVADNEVREDIFIPSHLPFQVLKNSIGTLCYLNNDGMLYILLDEFVYALDPEHNKASLFVRGLNEHNYKVSADGRMLAWQADGLANTATRIQVVDLETGSAYSVSAEEGTCIKALGFLDQDLVYGQGTAGRTYTTPDGEEYLLMEDLYVVDAMRNVQSSEHSSRGYFVTSVVEYNRVVVNRVVPDGDSFVKGDEFTLFSTDLESYPEASVYNIYDEDKRTINYVEVVQTMEPNKPATINDEMHITLCSAQAADVGDMISENGKYYVYSAGEIAAIMTSPAEAIMRAYYSTGVVVTSDGYFYRRASRPITVELTNVSIRNAIETYQRGDALNITGIYLTQALYYTGRKIPVIWEWYDSTYLIYGYDLFDNLMLLDIDTGGELLVAYEDIDAIFDETGRCYIVE